MPSVHKRSGSPYWFAAFYQADGRRAFRSTAQTSKRKALQVCLKYAEAAQLGRHQRLSEKRARDVISDIFAVSTAEQLPTATTRSYLKGWLAKKELEVADSSFPEFRKVVEDVLAFWGAKADRPIETIRAADAAAYRDQLVEHVSAATVNKKIKLLRGAWSHAVRDGVALENVFKRVDLVKLRDRVERRPFTLDELQRILAVCNDEWRGAVLCGLYLGQRMGDIVSLTWAQVDLDRRELRMTTRKTGKRILIPLARPLYDYFMSLSAPDDPIAPVFPTLSKRAVSGLSNDFRDIMASAGLSKPVDHPEGRSEKERDRAGAAGRPKTRRTVNEVSFHALRHTATTLLKAVGTSDVVARELIGHDSEVVSRAYTHLPFETLRDAVDRLPDITAPTKKSK